MRIIRKQCCLLLLQAIKAYVSHQQILKTRLFAKNKTVNVANVQFPETIKTPVSKRHESLCFRTFKVVGNTGEGRRAIKSKRWVCQMTARRYWLFLKIIWLALEQDYAIHLVFKSLQKSHKAAGKITIIVWLLTDESGLSPGYPPLPNPITLIALPHLLQPLFYIKNQQYERFNQGIVKRRLQSYRMNFLYKACQMYVRYALKVYYRQVEVIGKELIPERGPVLIIGNHNNLFVDGAMFINILDRHVNSITAAASWKNHPVLDAGLKMTGAIPISRSWDKVYTGKGTIVSVSKGLVVGKDTKFSEFKGGDALQLQNRQELRITSIEGDQLMRVKQEDYEYLEEGPFRILPRLDNTTTFEVVWSALNQDKCISIFPEGYSQDRLELLPFKNGFCIAALGALEKYGKQVTVVPCGMTYEDQSKFRSKITVQVGEPITIDQKLAELYKTNKSLAIKTLFNKVVQQEEQLVFDFRHYDRFEELKLIHAVFVQRYGDLLPARERMSELRRITHYYSDRLKEGNSQLDANSRELLQLSKMTGFEPTFGQETMGGALLSSFLVAFATLLMLPGYLLYYPSLFFILPKVEDYRLQCIRYTKNRLKGYDTPASATIMYTSAVFPITTALTLTIMYFIMSRLKWTSHTALFCIACYFLQPLYLLLFVKLWDLQHKYNHKLKRYLGLLFKKSLVLRFSRLSQQIITEISNHQHQPKPIPSFEDANICGPTRHF